MFFDCLILICFSVTCVLRYLETETNKKCPTCNILISRSDLKDILSPTHLPTSTSTLTTSTITKSTQTISNSSSNFLTIGSSVTFSLLLCLNGSLVPYSISSLQNNSSTSIVDIEQILTSLPSYRSIDMFYSRLSVASTQELLSLWSEKLTDIENYRNQCLESVILQEQIIEVETQNIVEKKSRGWETTSKTVSEPQIQPEVQVKQSQKQSSSSKINLEVAGVGDVEYLPLLPEAEEIIRSKMRTLKKNNNLSSSSTTKLSSKTKTKTTSQNTGTYNRLRKQDVVYMYQLSANSLPEEDRGIGFSCPIFLNPLCVRCLLTEIELQESLSSQRNEIIIDDDQSVLLDERNEMNDGNDGNNKDIVNQETVKNDKIVDESIQTLFNFPNIVTGEILEVITENVTEASKKRYPFIRHLPLDASYRIVEIDMRPIVKPEVYAK